MSITGQVRCPLGSSTGVYPRPVDRSPDAAAIAAATPDDRDRWIDFIRAFSIGVVVLGHWLVAVVVWRDGSISGFNVMEAIPGLWPLTWLLQVMPLFFFVGGFSNLVSLRSARRRGEGYAGFLRGRFDRLMRPTLAFLIPAVAIVATLDALNVADDAVFPVATLITGPLWFLGVYMIVIALAVPMAALHDRFGAWVPSTLGLIAVAVDIARFAGDFSGIGFVNYPVVWLLAHQLGFLYADGRLRPDFGRWLAPLGLAALVALVAAGPYPASMVGLATDEFSNMDPPTLAIVALLAWQIGLALWLRAPVTRWLESPRVWTAVVGVNSVIMTAFLWHLTVLVIAIGVLYPLGFPQPEVGTTFWWLLRPAWIGVLIVLLGALVAVLGPIERVALTRRRPASERSPGSASLAVVAAVATLWGVLGFAIGGLHQVFSPTGDTLLVFRLNPFQNLIHLAWGAMAMAAAVGAWRTVARAAALSAALASALAAAGPLLRAGYTENVLASNAAADLLHGGLAVLSLAAWWLARRRPSRVDTGAHRPTRQV